MNLTSNSLETVQPITEVSFITRLLSALRPDMVAAEGVTSSHQDASPERFRAVTEIPNDPKLPALVALRDICLKDAPQADDPGGMTLELLLCGYSEGTRATFEARAGNRRVAVKAYAEDAAPEAELYEALAAAGLGGDSGARVPPLLFWERQLRVLVIGWLEGPTAHDLIKDGRGARAGELAAHWIRRAASLTMKVGPPLGAAQLVDRVRAGAAAFGAVDPAMGTAALAVADVLVRTQPKERDPHLVHGTLYARHVLDLGDGPGVIDWQRFGHGPVELDAGMFLATIARVGLDHAKRAGEAARAEEAFLAGTRGLLDERSLGWHRAAALFQLAARRVGHPERHNPGRWRERIQALLDEAARHAGATG